MRLWVLGSGSRGNAVLVECGATRILVDAGFAPRILQTRLRAIGVAPESIAHCVVTHEHTDHVKGASAAARKWGWRLHATAGTLRACPDVVDAGATAFAAGDALSLGGLRVDTVRTPHDANESVALIVTSDATGARAGICYDLGHATDTVRTAMRDLDILVVEANHDEQMLRAGPYPPSVSARIAGRLGHLSNGAAGTLARGVVSRRLKHVVLAHLSQNCNTAETALGAVSAELARVRYRGALCAATQDGTLGPLDPRGGLATSVRAEQLQLF